MMRGLMATTKATKRKTAPATPRASTARADGRTKSPLVVAGDQAKIDAQRETLRAALVATGWNAAAAGKRPDVGITHAPTLSRLIDQLGLREEYDANQPK